MDKDSYSVFYDEGLKKAYLYKNYICGLKSCLLSSNKDIVYAVYENIQNGVYPSEKEMFMDIYTRLTDASILKVFQY